MSSQPPPLPPGENPYAAPQARVDDPRVVQGLDLAGRGTRLGAAIIDSLTYTPLFVAAFIVAVASRDGQQPSSGALMFLGVMGLILLAVLVINLVLVFRFQQTIGKKALNIKVVRGDGSPCDPWRIILLRGVVMGLLGAIPFLGKLVGLVDSLLIFRDNRHCLHDDIADTIVVNA